MVSRVIIFETLKDKKRERERDLQTKDKSLMNKNAGTWVHIESSSNNK
jgi:hypothetical protein